MSIEQTIKKAIEGGYKELPKKLNDEFDIWEYDHNAILLDPSFWKCLGKAMGWEKEVCSVCGIIPTIAKKRKQKICYSCGTEPRKDIKEWLYQWHRFINHLAEGKSAEEFFEKLK